jgi:hypothetical protein
MLAGARPPMMRSLPSAITMGRPRSMVVAMSTSSSLSSIVRCVAVGNPALATTCVFLDAALRRSLATFTGAVLPVDAVSTMGGIVGPPLQGFVSIVNIALSCSLSSSSDDASSCSSLSSSDEIPSGPFAPVAAFAVARRGGFGRRLAPSRFKDPRGIFPPAVFWRFAAAGPLSATGLPSFTPAVLPMPVHRVGLILGAIVGAICLLLNIGWFADASGQKSDVLAGSFASKNTMRNWGRYGLYGTLPEAFLVSGNY